MSDDAKQKLREVLEDVLSDDRTSLTDFEAVVNALWDKRIRTKGALRDVSEQELKDCGLDALASVIQHRLRAPPPPQASDQSGASAGASGGTNTGSMPGAPSAPALPAQAGGGDVIVQRGGMAKLKKILAKVYAFQNTPCGLLAVVISLILGIIALVRCSA